MRLSRHCNCLCSIEPCGFTLKISLQQCTVPMKRTEMHQVMSSLQQFRCEICGEVTSSPSHWFVIRCSDTELTVLKMEHHSGQRTGNFASQPFGRNSKYRVLRVLVMVRSNFFGFCSSISLSCPQAGLTNKEIANTLAMTGRLGFTHTFFHAGRWNASRHRGIKEGQWGSLNGKLRHAVRSRPKEARSRRPTPRELMPPPFCFSRSTRPTRRQSR